MQKEKPEESICISFQDNAVLPQLFGEQDKNLLRLEQNLSVKVSSRGNMVFIAGKLQDVYVAEAVLKNVYEKLQKGMEVGDGEVSALIRMLSSSVGDDVVVQDSVTKDNSVSVQVLPVPGKEEGAMVDKPLAEIKEVKTETKNKQSVHESGSLSGRPDLKKLNDIVIKTEKKHVFAYSRQQVEYMKSLTSRELTFASGPAGTGKTYLAVAAAVSLFQNKDVERIILTRPAVEAGEKLGFLPGDLKEKIDPYLRPLYDALYDMMPAEKVMHYLQTNEIEIAPLAFMRGRTLRHSYIILDEAQNTLPAQMKMFLTRLGEGSRMAITGDLSQTDLPKDVKSGFRDALQKLESIDEISIVRFGDQDVVRHPLTLKIVSAYDKYEKEHKWDDKK